MEIEISDFIVFSSFVFALFIIEMLTAILNKYFEIIGEGKVRIGRKFSEREVALVTYFLYVVGVGIAGVFIQDALTKYMTLKRGYFIAIVATLILVTYFSAVIRIGYRKFKDYDAYILFTLLIIVWIGLKFGNIWGGLIFLLGIIGFYLLFLRNR